MPQRRGAKTPESRRDTIGRLEVRFLIVAAAIVGIAMSPPFPQTSAASVHVQRLLDHPMINPDLHPSIGSNIQVPSLIPVAGWVAVGEEEGIAIAEVKFQ
jgi:hypothetical protein